MTRRRGLTLLLAALLLTAGMARAQDAPQYVVATHYPAFGGVEPAPRDAVTAAYTVYNNRENDYLAVDAATADAVLARIEQETGLDVRMHNTWAEVQEGSSALQIVNNVPIEGALYTLILPHGWTKSARLPVLLSGNGAGTSNNKRLFGDKETIVPWLVAGSAAEGGGLIAALSNAGGTESQGIDEATYRSVGAFFDWIHQNGGDKYNAVTGGASRGGGSALMWAINPLDLDYDVHTVLAEVPPTHYGTLSQISPLTFPSMASIATLVGQSPDAWRYDNPGLRPGLNPSPFMETLIGVGDPDAADAISPIGLAERLKGKQVLLSAGAHDAFFPLSPYLAFARRLQALGVHHAAAVTLASGHELHDFYMQTVTVYLLALARGVKLTLPSGRFYFIETDLKQNTQRSLAAFFRERGIDADPRRLPVIARFPWKAGVGNPADIEICGAPGDVVELTAASAAGGTLYAFSGTLGADECHFEQIIIDAPVGEYAWSLTVNGQPVNPRHTPTRGDDGCGLPAVTTVQAEQPAPAELYAFNRDMAFGLDQYSGQPESCR